MQSDGTVGRIRRAVILGSVADIPTKRDAQARLDELIRPVNQGTSRPEAFVTFGGFVETQWKPLVLPTFKASTQHGYKTVLGAACAAGLARLAAPGHRTARQYSSGSRRSSGRGLGWQTVRNAWVLLSGILETAVEYGYLQSNPARGVKFPQKALKKKPAMIAGDELREAAQAGRRTVSDDGESHRRDGLASRRAAGVAVGCARSRRSARWRCASRCTRARFRRRRRRRALRTIPLGPHAVKALTEHRERGRRGRSRTIWCSAIARAIRCASRRC